MYNDLTTYTDSIFERIKQLDENGNEFWPARELSKALDYSDYRNFELVIMKSMQSCQNAGQKISDHFGEVTEMVAIGSGAKRSSNSYNSRAMPAI